MKYYISASYNDRIVAKAFSDKMVARGHIPTCEWWVHWDERKSEQYCEEDIKGVREADVLVCYNGHVKTSGKLIEIGIAIGLGKPVYLFGKPLKSVFRHRIVQLHNDKEDYDIGWVIDVMLQMMEYDVE